MTQKKFEVPSSVGLTAFAACAARSIEGSRRDRLISDPFAAKFVHGAKLGNQLPLSINEVEQDSMLSSRFAGVRTRVFDDFLRTSIDRGVVQVVILATGLDARAFRLPWLSNIDLYEVDHPDVLTFKDAVLSDIGAQPHCRRHVVAADLAEGWGTLLQAAGYDQNSPTAWMAEGLLPYLSPQAEKDLVSTIRAMSSVGSWLCLEYMPSDVVAKFRDHQQLEMTSDALGVSIREMWNAEPREEVPDLLRGLGWAVNFQSLEDCAVSLGTPLLGEFYTPSSDAEGADSGNDFSPADMARCGYVTGELPALSGDAGK
jgi:methyltransferase (TIGR00027 family)